MSFWSRIANAFRGDRVNRELDEELDAHIAEAIAAGRDPAEAHLALGSALRRREESRDFRLVPWLDSLRADAVFGWRQIWKRKVTSAAAILSLALGLGACTAAFRLVDALLFRPLPVADPGRLYVLSREVIIPQEGKLETFDDCAYPMFRQMRAQVKDYAELIAISYAARVDLTYSSGEETEKAYQQLVSGWMFHSFGIRPALGRLFTEDDDRTPGAHPYAVLSYDYWTRRFARDPHVIGRTFRMDNYLYQIVGVAEKPFTGTETGTVTDIFIPTMMVQNQGIERSDYSWFRTFVRLKPGVSVELVRQRLRVPFRAFLEERVKSLSGMPTAELDLYLNQTLMLTPAAAGVSRLQKEYRRPLVALGILVALVLLIACANVANLMTAQAAARAREMALRVSIGAGRWRLVQLVLIESAWLAFLAAATGAFFAWWSAPFVIRMINPPDNPARLYLPADWRVIAFAPALALGVMFLFGLIPALRASSVKPAAALKGGDDPHARRRVMHALIAVQVAFCFLVLFVAGLFVATFDRLTRQSTGFSSVRLVTLETLTPSPQPLVYWQQVAGRLQNVPGVEAVAISEWPLMTGESWQGFIGVHGGPPKQTASYFLRISPGWRNVMRIPLLAGRDFRESDKLPGLAMVNRAFARLYFGEENPVGQSFDIVSNEGPRYPVQVVGLVGDARYRNMRESMQPVAYFPLTDEYARCSLIVRTASPDPMVLAQTLRREVSAARSEFRVSNVRTQAELIQSHTVRERLLAMLAVFFSAVALLLAGIGLYGVLDYSVLQRRREIGIRMAIGAPAADIARRVTTEILSMVLVGAMAGLVSGLAAARLHRSVAVPGPRHRPGCAGGPVDRHSGGGVAGRPAGGHARGTHRSGGHIAQRVEANDMSLWSRITNAIFGDRLNRDIDEELHAHLAEAVAQGRDPAEARQAFGSPLRRREESRDLRLIPWLDSLRADAVFGWRQIWKKKVTSAAAILSLALAMGASTAAFRLIDALLLRPLPVAHPERLYVFAIQGFGPAGDFRVSEGCEYPLFRRMRAAVKGQADLLAISYAEHAELTYASDQEMEKAYRQFVSGSMFDVFGLKPVLGRLFTQNDDVAPGAHPYAVLSYDYWRRRFGLDPNVVGRTFTMGTHLYQIIGVAPEPFTGTEPGTITDIFLPTMMNAGVNEDDWSWIRAFVQVKPEVSTESVRERLQAVFQPVQEERAKGFTGWPKNRLDNFLHQKVLVEPASGGVSEMRKGYRAAVTTLAVLVALVLLITCANLANLLTAQAAARAREMALRVSIGAGRWRLVQLVLVESALLAILAALPGALLASWAAPFVVDRINPPDNPARLLLSADWRVLGFALALALGVTFLFGLAPALRASAVKPASALKGGDDPHARRRFMHALIAAQVAFCFVVLFLAGLFASTFERLSNQPTGFSADRLLAVDTAAAPAQRPVYWNQLVAHIRTLPGVESVALAAWPLLSGPMQGAFVAVSGAPASNVLSYSLRVSPGWFDAMKIPLIDGRDIRPDELGPGVAVVNQAFADAYFHGQEPVGKSFDKVRGGGHFEIVGLVRNARYQTMREPLTPTAYIPMWFGAPDEALSRATLLVRTSMANPLALASTLRREVPRAWPEFRVSNIRTQLEINQSQTIRERLLAMLALFFAVVALLLAAIGLYGVLDYSVLQRRREISIRIAVGAQAGDVARRVTRETFTMVLVGALAGAGLGLSSVRYIQTLLYGVKGTGLGAVVVPSVTILSAALLAALPSVIRAVRIDPAAVLRGE